MVQKRLLPLLLTVSTAFADDTKNVNVNIHTSGGGAWYANYWLIGLLLLALIVVVVAVAARGNPNRA